MIRYNPKKSALLRQRRNSYQSQDMSQTFRRHKKTPKTFMMFSTCHSYRIESTTWELQREFRTCCRMRTCDETWDQNIKCIFVRKIPLRARFRFLGADVHLVCDVYPRMCVRLKNFDIVHKRRRSSQRLLSAVAAQHFTQQPFILVRPPREKKGKVCFFIFIPLLYHRRY